MSTTWLSKHFQTTPRTIQRDIILLKEADFPLNESSRGNYQIDKTLLKNFDVFDDTELALVIAIKNLVGQLGKPFEQAADDIFNKLYEDVTTSPVFIKIDDSVILDKQQFKRYALDKIKEFKPLNKNFRCVPPQIDRMLKESGNIWFSSERNIEVVVEVDKSCAHYFRRRKVFPHQEIKEERADGSIIVLFKVGSLDEIKNTIKVWLPYIRIIQPEELKNIFLEDMKAWISWQKKA